MTNILQEIRPYLPPTLRRPVEMAVGERTDLEEIRLRTGRPVALRFRDGDCFISAKGTESTDEREALRLSLEQMREAVLLLSNSSFYALAEQLCRGYITLPGGHRAGFSGRAVLSGGAIKNITDISSVNIRLARWLPGAAATVRPFLGDGQPLSTLLVSPPRAGKTTILRDLARGFSADGYNVSVVDERSELAAMQAGLPQFPLGPRVDVLDGCPKAEGMMLMIRSMAPDIIICDELGRPEDAVALREAANAGVSVLASAHGADKEELLRRPIMADILGERTFERIIFLSRRRGPGTVESVLDSDLQPVEV